MRPPFTTAVNRVPSADEAMDNQLPEGALVACAQVVPELVEIKIGPPNRTAARLLPSAEAVTDRQLPAGTLFDIHVAPELVEV